MVSCSLSQATRPSGNISLHYYLKMQKLRGGPQPPLLQKQLCESERSGQSCYTPLGLSPVMVIMMMEEEEGGGNGSNGVVVK